MDKFRVRQSILTCAAYLAWLCHRYDSNSFGTHAQTPCACKRNRGSCMCMQRLLFCACDGDAGRDGTCRISLSDSSLAGQAGATNARQVHLWKIAARSNCSILYVSNTAGRPQCHIEAIQTANKIEQLIRFFFFGEGWSWEVQAWRILGCWRERERERKRERERESESECRAES